MNDEFLYALRVQPPASFAAKLKARLAIQASLVAAKRRARNWVLMCGVLLGTTAVAFVSPTTRGVVASWFWGPTASMIEVPAESRIAPTNDPALAIDSRGAQSRGAEDSDSAAQPSKTPPKVSASLRASAASSAALQRPITVHSMEAPAGFMEDIFENFHDTYGYEVQRSLASEGEKVCSKYRVSDVIASMGRLSDAQLTNCANLGVRLIEVPLAYEAYVAVIHRENTWVDSLTLEEIGATNKRWPHDPLTATWNQLRASWPSLPITVLGLDVGPSAVDARFVPTRSTRGFPIKVDKKAADLPRAIEADYGSLGFMPFSTYETLMAKVRESRSAAPVKVVGIVNARGDSIMPSRATIQNGQYDTLSRPLLFYFNEERLLRREVSLFATHAIESASQRAGDDLVAIDMLTIDAAARKIRNQRGRP